MTISNQHSNRPLRILVLGSARSGKSAVTVRYLTKRYIGEYSSCKDFLYRHSINIDEIKTEIEIMDTSGAKSGQTLYDQISWADAFVVVYSVCDLQSFLHARYLLDTISVLKESKRERPTILLGNMRDLDHARQVAVDDGQETSLQWRCQFYECSAAESLVGVSLAFQSLIREAWSSQRQHQTIKSPTLRRKTSPAMAVSKMIASVFGRPKTTRSKKRPSLSI